VSDLDLLERPGLDARVTVAFSASATSSFVMPLITEVETALTAARLEAEQCRADALDPRLPASAQRNARALASDAEFSRDRLSAAAAKLKERLAELRDQEENTKRKIAYDKAQAERDRVAEELRVNYPDLTQKLVDLLTRLQASDHQVAAVNVKLPRDMPRLERAEMVGKGIIGKSIIGFESVAECRVSPWTPSSKALWPPR
jgi:hypothetical protein